MQSSASAVSINLQYPSLVIISHHKESLLNQIRLKQLSNGLHLGIRKRFNSLLATLITIVVLSNPSRHSILLLDSIRVGLLSVTVVSLLYYNPYIVEITCQ